LHSNPSPLFYDFIYLEAELNEQLELLVKLQEIDTTILSLAEEIDQLSRKAGKDSLILKEARASFDNVKAKHDGLIRKKKEQEQELKEVQDRIEKSKAKSSELKSNKEYEAHLKEIESLRKKIDRIEEEILRIMDEIDVLAGELGKEEEKVKKAEEECREDERIIEEEKGKLYSSLETFKSKRKEFINRINADHYDLYMNLLKRLDGLAVVEAENEVCMGCNTNIPPQLYNEVKENDRIINCYYCHRFLYHKDK
jgi:predicted  nucleic acid-binding Zn-ribbon protein